jgi:hypothetical protein
MSKAKLLEIVAKDHDKQEEHYLHCGPNKHQQDDLCGVQMVQENYNLLVSYLMEVDTGNGTYDDLSGVYQELSREEQREVWEASAFHFGIYGYDERDAAFFWHPDNWKTP